MQVWFQNRRAKFRRNERSILAQRTQLQQFAAANVGRKCVSSSPSQLTDDFHHRQLHHHHHHHQQQYVAQSSASPADGVSTSTSWQASGATACGGALSHYVHSAGAPSPSAPTCEVDLFYSTSDAVSQSAGSFDSLTTVSSALHQQLNNDDRTQSTAAAAMRQRIKEFTTAYTTQTATSF